MATAFVLAVRHPDEETTFTVDGDVRIITIDLGSAFDGKPYDSENAWSFVEGVDDMLRDVPTTSPVFQQAITTMLETVSEFPDAAEHVEQYALRRNTPRTTA